MECMSILIYTHPGKELTSAECCVMRGIIERGPRPAECKFSDSLNFLALFAILSGTANSTVSKLEEFEN